MLKYIRLSTSSLVPTRTIRKLGRLSIVAPPNHQTDFFSHLNFDHRQHSSLLSSIPPRPPPNSLKMDSEDPQERPDDVSNIINGLERYNPEAVGSLEDYLRHQCENRYTDSNANRTLLKL